jgi:hypothetical protein
MYVIKMNHVERYDIERFDEPPPPVAGGWKKRQPPATAKRVTHPVPRTPKSFRG